DAGLAGQRLHQQFPGPGRPSPAVPLGAGADDPVQGVQVALVQLGGAVVLPAVEQAPLPLLAEALGHAVDGGVVHAQHRGRLVAAPAVEEVTDDQVAEAEAGLAATAQVPEESLLDGEADLEENRWHGNSLLGACAPSDLTLGIPIFASPPTSF